MTQNNQLAHKQHSDPEFDDIVKRKLMTIAQGALFKRLLAGEAPDDKLILNELVRLSKQHDPITLATLVFFAVFGHDKSETPPGEESLLQQSHLEILLALILTVDLKWYRRGNVITSDALNVISSGLVEAQLAAFLILRDRLPAENDHPKVKIRVDTYAQTLFIRNQGSPSQIKELVRRFFAPTNEQCIQNWGFSVSEFFDAATSLQRELELRLTKYLRKIRQIAEGSTRNQRRNLYKTLMKPSPKEQKAIEALIAEKQDNGSFVDELLVACVRRHTAIFALTEWQRWLPQANPRELEALLDRLSFCFGDLATFDLDYVFLGNPVWSRPFIRVREKEWLCLGVFLLNSFPIQIGQTAIASLEGAVDRFNHHKGHILEEWIHELTCKVFGEPSTYLNVARTEAADGETGENDIVVFTDGLLILIEAKSGEADEAAGRGGALSLKSAAEHLIAEPSSQSGRFVRFLQNHSTVTLPSVNKELTLAYENVRRLVRLSITFEYLGLLSSRLLKFRQSGTLATGPALAPVINMLDYDSMVDLLESPIVITNYLSHREDLELDPELDVADESDYLAFYLKYRFTDESLERLKTHEIFGSTQQSSDYFQFRKGMKPKISLSRFFAELIFSVQHNRVPGWTFAGSCLLDCPQSLEKNIDEARSQLRAATTSDAEGRGVSFTWKFKTSVTCFTYVCMSGAPRSDSIERFRPARSPARFNLLIIEALNDSGTSELHFDFREADYSPIVP
jgi:hypothetical protein